MSAAASRPPGSRTDGRGTSGRRAPPRTAGRRVLGASPPLLEDDVALAPELAEHRVQQAVALHLEPQLETVGGKLHVVVREVVLGRGVRARPSRPAVTISSNSFLTMSFFCSAVDRLDLLASARPALSGVWNGSSSLSSSEWSSVPQLLSLVQERLLLRPVERADGGRPLEHHVLEEVRDPAPPLGVDRAADVELVDGGERRRDVVRSRTKMRRPLSRVIGLTSSGSLASRRRAARRRSRRQQRQSQEQRAGHHAHDPRPGPHDPAPPSR